MTPELRKKRLAREQKQNRKGHSLKRRLVNFACSIPFIKNRGLKNALDLQINEFSWHFSNLPKTADGLRILHLSDTHLDGVPGLLEALKKKISSLEFDLAVLTGDYRFDKGAFEQKTIDPTLELIRFLQTKAPVYAVPGNHDCLDTLDEIVKTGAKLLVNSNDKIFLPVQVPPLIFAGLRNGNPLQGEFEGDSVPPREFIQLAGVDDPHYFETHDLELALQGLDPKQFTLLLAHSPEIIPQAAEVNVDFYLCGHTHGGQVRLPLLGMVHWNARCARKYADGHFTYRELQGFTHRGTGSSNSPIRFNCPPEIVLHSLRKKT